MCGGVRCPEHARRSITATGTRHTNLISERGEFPGMNEVYGEFFDKPYPARTAVSAGLGPGTKVEIDGIAVLPE